MLANCRKIISRKQFFSTAVNLNQKLGGKTAMVTASTEGIGFAIAKRLAEDGCNVMVSSRSAEKVETALNSLKSTGLKVHGIPCHVSNKDQREQLLEETLKQFGRVDFLVSNAAANPFFGSILDCSEEEWDEFFDVNVKPGFLLSKLVVPEMKKNETGGSIVIVTSIAGYDPMPNIGPYCVTKTALLGLVKALSSGLAKDNIRVNGIAPGLIHTKFASPLISDKEFSKKILQDIPMKRFGVPEEIGGTASYLCSDDSKYMTGETIVVAGGLASRL